jgi:hypothetical protein
MGTIYFNLNENGDILLFRLSPFFFADRRKNWDWSRHSDLKGGQESRKSRMSPFFFLPGGQGVIVSPTRLSADLLAQCEDYE